MSVNSVMFPLFGAFGRSVGALKKTTICYSLLVLFDSVRSELRSCVKVEVNVAVLDLPSLIVLTVSVDVKQQ